MKIRKAIETDLPELVNIYNQAIVSRKTADLHPFHTAQRMAWFESHQNEMYPLFIAEINNQRVAYMTLSPYRGARAALRSTVEISYYVHENFHRRGVGTALLKVALEKSKILNFKTAIAILLESNVASISLLEKFGFEKWGYLPDVADFGGEQCGHLYYGRRV